jgi:tol-pal system protein YbgF
MNMRIPSRSLLLALALVAAASPAFAQRVSLADRVARLEQQAANNQGNVDLLNQVTQLRSEVQALRAQLEELQQQNEQLKQSARNQYLDLDGRISQLEGRATSTTTSATSSTTVAKPAAAPVPSRAVTSSTPPARSTDRAPAVYGDAGRLAQGADERSAYNAAFDVLKAGNYVESARLFQQFLDAYPSGSYAPNALYWLGESYYVTQNYALAQQQFQTLLDRYPTHDKAPGALLKVGLAQYGLRQMDAAEATLSQVAQRYPGSDAARTAEDRLRAIQLNRTR